MKLERTYVFNIDKYIELMGNCDFKNNFNMRYKYNNKQGQESIIDIKINIHKINSFNVLLGNVLLGNDVANTVTYNQPFATIVFDNLVEYKNFVTPNWLEVFKYRGWLLI